MRKMGIFIFIFIILIISLYIASEIILPRIAEKRIREEILTRIDAVEELKIDARVFPAFKLLFSRIDKLEVEARGLQRNHLYLKDIKANYQEILITDNRQIMAQNTGLKVLITQKALNSYLDNNYPHLENFQIKLTPGQVFLQGYLNILENKFKINLAGEFTIRNKNKIYFLPESSPNSSRYPLGFTINLSSKIPLGITLDLLLKYTNFFI